MPGSALRWAGPWLALVVLAGCPQPEPEPKSDPDADGDGWTRSNGDCDDEAPGVHPTAPETCDGVDEDCSGTADDAPVDGVLAWTDADGDGLGAAASPVLACVAAAGTSADPTDCDDADSAVLGPTSWTVDADGDGYADESAPIAACVAPTSWTPVVGDCNDANPGVNPAATETCNGIDDDCDALVDDADDSRSGGLTWYADADNDGFGDPTQATASCLPAVSTTLDATDCDDAEATTFPGAEEDCDHADSDCDGSTWDDRLTNARDGEFDYSTADSPTVREVGDVTGDGERDLLLSYPAFGAGNAYTGMIAVAPGPVASFADASRNDQVYGPPSTHFGYALVDLGDTDGDGSDDLLVGLPGDDYFTGPCGVNLLLGPSAEWTSSSHTDSPDRAGGSSDSAGYAMAGPEDLDGDGEIDVVVGAPGDSSDRGLVYLVTDPGSPTGDLADTALAVAGGATGDGFGSAVAILPDLDGDGIAEAAVGAPYEDSGGSAAGAVYVLGAAAWASGNVADAEASFTGEATTDYAGSALAGLPDLDGDGYAELAVAAPWSDSGGANSGIVYIVYGPVAAGTASLGTAGAILHGNEASLFGTALSPSPDLNDDGRPDLLVGAPNESSGDGYAWAFYAPILGNLTTADAQVRFRGSNGGAELGGQLDASGDVTGDGLADVAISESDWEYVYLWAGPVIDR